MPGVMCRRVCSPSHLDPHWRHNPAGHLVQGKVHHPQAHLCVHESAHAQFKDASVHVQRLRGPLREGLVVTPPSEDRLSRLARALLKDLLLPQKSSGARVTHWGSVKPPQRVTPGARHPAVLRTSRTSLATPLPMHQGCIETHLPGAAQTDPSHSNSYCNNTLSPLPLWPSPDRILWPSLVKATDLQAEKHT